jgi:NDMA-dependent alcohol dehydrogenase
MKTQAAVLWDYKQDWSIEEVEIDDPKQGEVMVKLASSGLCHSDEHVREGDLPVGGFPFIGGHEGAGVVEKVGPGVTSVAEGDHVVLGFIPACGRCPSCSSGHQNLCDLGAFLLDGLQVTDQTARHHVKGQDARLMCCIGTFAPYTVVSEANAIKIDDDLPLDKASLVGCGVTTGWGSAVYSAQAAPGQTVVVVGIGGVGANAVQGAALAGAKNVVAIDPVEFKREQAQMLGATHTAQSMTGAEELITDLTRGALADSVIITVGVPQGHMIAEAMALTKKNGTVVLTSVANAADTQVTLSMFDLTLFQKKLVGSIFGSANPRYDIPRLLALYQAGQLKLDELVTQTYSLEQINEGYQAMRDGKNVRGMVMYS